MKVKPGLEVFFKKHLDLVRDKKIGLVTNPTGIDRNLNSNVDLLFTHKETDLTALYGPEHGINGEAQAGEGVPFSRENKFGLPVYSLYGQVQKPSYPKEENDIDAHMRSYDILMDGKIPQGNMLQDIEVLIFDIQDIGTRIYTYIATMALCMQICAKKGIEFIVLDRPNPINGIVMEGPVLDYPRFSSFVGLYPIPVRHGMTIGELAVLFNENFMQSRVDLKVIPMENWERQMWFKDTGLPWINPSPNIPRPETAMVYPGQVFLEGTNLSEGRGTTLPFEIFGAPWINADTVCRKLNGKELPGVVFRAIWFYPFYSKHRSTLCGGAQVHIQDRNEYLPFLTAMTVLSAARELYTDKLDFFPEYFDKIMGTDKVRPALLAQKPVPEILGQFYQGIQDFKEERKAYLLY